MGQRKFNRRKARLVLVTLGGGSNYSPAAISPGLLGALLQQGFGALLQQGGGVILLQSNT